MINRREFLSSAAMMGGAITLGTGAELPLNQMQPSETYPFPERKEFASERDEIQVNFARTLGKIRPLHGVNNGPKCSSAGTDHTRWFRQARIPYCRLHDTEYPFGSGHFVDIPCIFKDFEADPTDPASYDFFLTDLYIEAIENAGAKAFYRLGVSIENPMGMNLLNKKFYNTYPPADNMKWARICEGIIRHYNEGWADGYHYGIQYWEIWNEPEHPTAMWQGTSLDFFRLYETAASHLKRTFPDIKVGGYAGCGFYREEYLERFKKFFEDFLTYITSPEHASPLDFFSWHTYCDHPDIIVRQSKYVRTRLDACGLTNTENIFNEWNYVARPDVFERMRTVEAAVFVASTMMTLQRQTDVTLAAYYDAQPSLCWCGIFNHTGALKPFYAFQAYGELYGLGTEAAIERDAKDVYALAATNGTDGALLLSNFSDEPKTVMARFSGLSSAKDVTVSVKLLDETHNLDTVRSEIFFSNEQILPFALDKKTVALITLQTHKG